MSPLISVYITNYNYERFLKKAIDSVLAQSCRDFELLIIMCIYCVKNDHFEKYSTKYPDF